MLEIMAEPAIDPAPVPAPARRSDDAITAELAFCLRRFLAASADEPTMERARRALAAWDERGAAARR